VAQICFVTFGNSLYCVRNPYSHVSRAKWILVIYSHSYRFSSSNKVDYIFLPQDARLKKDIRQLAISPSIEKHKRGDIFQPPHKVIRLSKWCTTLPDGKNNMYHFVHYGTKSYSVRFPFRSFFKKELSKNIFM